MSPKRLANLIFWAAAFGIVAYFVYTTVAGGYRVGGREGLIWSTVLLLGLVVGAVLTAAPAKRD
ncbi:hypothetical protein [Caulobacter sp.]|uniref:hypothetical protein n=1 Tax=Caulobacter sp. TaxID=78 RepID=UPI003BAE8FA0